MCLKRVLLYSQYVHALVVQKQSSIHQQMHCPSTNATSSREMGHFVLGTLEHTYFLSHGYRIPYRNKTFNKLSLISSTSIAKHRKTRIKSLSIFEENISITSTLLTEKSNREQIVTVIQLDLILNRALFG